MQQLLKKNYNKIGILGGTFDPPHKGHVHISKIALKKLKLDKLIWVVTKKNPLKKKPYLSLKSRINLSKKIIKKEKKIFVKYFDNKINSTNTFPMLNFIKRKNRKKKLFFLIGADNLVKFHKWNNWQKIPRLAKIIIFPRKGYSIKSINPYAMRKLNKKDFLYIKTKKENFLFLLPKFL